ncbi:MAG TPA: hypothetical protein VNM22_21120 [Candidatus Limnocylindrales bacterium]|nr:hypothetical protein [Candidatus Limnocylindrales bacterium]
MPVGAWSPEREQEYEKLKEEFKKEGRYKGREEEVAARIVNKQRREFKETKEASEEDKNDQLDQELPIENYDRLTVQELTRKLGSLSEKELQEIEEYEKKHKNRKTALEAMERQRKKLQDGKEKAKTKETRGYWDL